MAVKVGINGFRTHRTQRASHRAQDKNLEFVAVNDLTDPKTLAHLLKYDSILGNLPHNITAGADSISIDGKIHQGLQRKRPGRPALGVRRRAGRHRVHRPLHRCQRSQEAPARHGEESHHLRSRPRTKTSPSCWASTKTSTMPPSTTSSRTRPAPPTAWRRSPRSSTTTSRSSAAP